LSTENLLIPSNSRSTGFPPIKSMPTNNPDRPECGPIEPMLTGEVDVR
jgi:hypothetical protein